MQKRQQRRVFEAAFKVEAVRRLHERLANNIPLSVIARELAVRPQQLRGWEKQLASPVGQAVHDVFPGGAPAQRGGGGAPPATRISPG